MHVMLAYSYLLPTPDLHGPKPAFPSLGLQSHARPTSISTHAHLFSCHARDQASSSVHGPGLSASHLLPRTSFLPGFRLHGSLLLPHVVYSCHQLKLAPLQPATIPVTHAITLASPYLHPCGLAIVTSPSRPAGLLFLHDVRPATTADGRQLQQANSVPHASSSASRPAHGLSSCNCLSSFKHVKAHQVPMHQLLHAFHMPISWLQIAEGKRRMGWLLGRGRKKAKKKEDWQNSS